MRASKGRRGGRRLDVSQLRELVRDGRVWSGIGIVTLFPGEASHYELSGEDVLVDVALQPSGEPVLCRLGAVGAGGGGGVWAIPPVGAEVAVIIPGGELEADALIVATLSTGVIPSELDAETLVVKQGTRVRILAADAEIDISGGNVHIKAKAGGVVSIDDGSGAQELATYADLFALAKFVDSHTHLYSPGTLAAAPTGKPVGTPTVSPTTVIRGK